MLKRRNRQIQSSEIKIGGIKPEKRGLNPAVSRITQRPEPPKPIVIRQPAPNRAPGDQRDGT